MPNLISHAFYKSLYPVEGLRVLATFKNGLKKPPTHSFYDNNDDLMADAATNDGLGRNVYHGCAVYKTSDNRKGDNVLALQALWLDLDVGPKKPYAGQKEAVTHYERFRIALGLPLAHIVGSGGGIHVYQPLSKPIVSEEWDRLAAMYAACLDHFGVKHDTSRTQDKASILRIPGTDNHKTNPAKAVTLKRLGQASSAAGLWKLLKAYADTHGLIVGAKPPKRAAPVTNDLIGTKDYPPADGALVAASCPILQEVDATGGDVPYEIWWRAMGVAKYCEYGDTVAQQWTRDRCSPAHDKSDWQAVTAAWAVGPTTCADFGKHSSRCGSCHHSGKVKSPIQIGRSAIQADDHLRGINEKYAWIEADASIYRLEHQDFIDPAKFKTQHDNQIIQVPNGSGTKKVGAGSLWLKAPSRREHKRLVLRPGEKLVTGDNLLNEWQGFSVTAQAGRILPFLWLLRRLIPNRAAWRYTLKWLAHLIQHPDTKMNVSLAFWSQQQGVGKNLLFECISSIIGAAHSTVIGQAELAAPFNGWASRKVLVIGDEVSNSDRRQDTDKLKGLVTGSTIYINEKYQPARAIPNLLNFIFLSNHHDALFVGDHDRRYFVWEICADRLPDSVAKSFVNWRDGGGLSSLHFFLMNFNLSGFNPKAAAPLTDAKLQMVQDNRSDLENWVAELMDSNVATLLGRELATANELAKRYAFETNHKVPSAKTIVSACKKHGAFARVNQVRMPTGKKHRVLALAQPKHWEAQKEAEWVTEMSKPFKCT